MESHKDFKGKLRLIQDALIKRMPVLKEEFDADPRILESIFAELPLEIHYRRPSSDILTHEEKEKVRAELYPQVHLLFEYLRPLWKRWADLKDCDTKLQQAVLSHVKNNADMFSYIKEHHLRLSSLFQLHVSRPDRHFCGTLLNIMVKDSFNKKIGATELWKVVRMTG